MLARDSIHLELACITETLPIDDHVVCYNKLGMVL